MVTCPSCQTLVPAGAKFCSNCGANLAPRPVEGERRLATLLFADVVGSTSMAERLDPEVWAEIMNGAFQFLIASVEEFGGTVGRLMGDGVLAFFGAPLSHEDDPERAVRAALRIVDQSADYSARLLADHGLEFNVRVGINTGLVVLARVGDKSANEYTAMGDTANLAARLQSLAAPATILIGPDTYQQVKHLTEVSPVGEVSVKGRSAPLAAYKVLGLKSAPGRSRGIEGITSPLVGRDAEFGQLGSALVALGQGSGAFVTVTGEAGLGKSRLVAELRVRATELAGHEVRWFEGRGVSYAQSTVYFPWQQIIRASIGAREGNSPEQVLSLLERFRERRGLPADAQTILEQVLGVGSESHPDFALLEADAWAEKLTAALKALLRSLATTTPTVLVFEDLHWADRPSVEALISVAAAVEHERLLILCVLRPEQGNQSHSWDLVNHLRQLQPNWAIELELQPLGIAQSKELLGNLLFIEDLPESVRALILSKAEGNPFFIEEVIRTLIDSGHVVDENGRWRARSEIVDVSIPDTLLGVLSARMDRLPELTRAVAQTASVIGRIFPHRVLAAVCGEGPIEERIIEIDPHLQTLSHEELVRESRHQPELEYIFKHALTQEAAYQRLLLKRRRELHRRTAQVLERLHEDDRSHAALLAYHAINGEAWNQSARYSRVAGEQALGIFAVAEAHMHFHNAVDALERLPEAPPTQFLEAILAWADTSVRLRRHEQMSSRQELLARLARAERLARELDDKRILARVLVAKGNVLSLSGFPAQAFPILLEASDLATAVGDESLFLLPYFATTDAMVHHDPRAAAEQFEHVIELARKHHNVGIEAHALASKAMALARLGSFDSAERTIQEALELAPRSHSLIKEADVHISAGAVYYDLGQLEIGLRHSVYGLQKAVEANGMECACAAYIYAGLGHFQSQDFDRALQDFEGAAQLGEGLSMMESFLNMSHAGKALVRLTGGDSSAVEELERTLENARSLGDAYMTAYIAHGLGDALTRMDDPERGREHLREAEEYYRGRGMKPYLARVLRSLAVGHEAQGRLDEATTLRAEAEELSSTLQVRLPASAAGTVMAGGRAEEA